MGGERKRERERDLREGGRERERGRERVCQNFMMVVNARKMTAKK